MNYFAYGSNMALDRLRARVPSARLVGFCTLGKHDLRFHKIGKDGSAKCDAAFTGLDADVVEGVVFEIDPDEVGVLDNIEGLGKGYDKANVQVSKIDGKQLGAFTYVATRTDASLLPFTWYKRHVLIGARSAGLSPEYISRIERIEAVKDPDKLREQRELAVHERGL